MFDLIIKGGIVYDGSGKKAYHADIGITGGTIESVSESLGQQARKVVHCDGLAVCPGFIDMHSHSDFSLLHNPRAESKVRQGITTELVGNCGFTPAPVDLGHFDELMQYLVNTVAISDKEKKEWTFHSQREFLERLESSGIAVNIASLVGHGTIKVAAMGFKKGRPSTSEMNKMLNLLEAELEQGIFGMSTGLQYEPGIFSSFDELSELAGMVADHGGIYTTHMKSEGKFLLECIEEAINLAGKTGVSLQISHLKAHHPSNWGKVTKALQLIDDARSNGLNVDFDVYPYTAFGSGLMDLLPPWAREQGSEGMTKLLGDGLMRDRMAKDMAEGLDGWENPVAGMGWECVRIATVASEKNKRFEGLNMLQVAEILGCPPGRAVMELLYQEAGAVKMIFFGMNEDDLITIMKHPRAIYSTDGRVAAPYGMLSKGKPHPRYYGTYPRILGHYVRERNIIRMEEAIYKMTYLPATKIGLKNRGLIKEGYCADITVFDTQNIRDLATYDDPHSYPEGIVHVFVNGRAVISNGIHTGELPGKILQWGQA